MTKPTTAMAAKVAMNHAYANGHACIVAAMVAAAVAKKAKAPK